ncbi:unnamed protein product [Rotaria magnacalcarata]|uniref:EF-hand domain-containing protein n=1 Tax=Rotaria magnacalcarata TaxID=392030 RepID=A0A815PI49_9BILA|nr:unnamed protein product [Rotaria magnacalcarata]CAF1449324.1 unnamed protein product [Rotaria magnacalcarata]CAF2104467.1 unnamed protein product [Rotaria magnacalcarata]CAF3868285.1 unnamed protein product [Rotaria magnacalcarata]CAF3894456.1 unnamed protein product [Rotaria magnacalcarata]
MSTENKPRPTSHVNADFDKDSVGVKTSGGASPMGSNIFIVQTDENNATQIHPETYRHEPITKTNFGQAILRGIRSLWATRQTEKNLQTNKDLYIKTTIKELVLYLVFIAILCIITFGMTSTKTYYFTTVLRSVFTERNVEGPGAQPAYDDIANFDDFWNVMNGPIINALFDQKWYNGENLTNDQYGYVLFENKILGLPRVRQLRVTNHSCTVHEIFQQSIRECYGPYSSSRENRSSYLPENDAITPNAWHYQTSKQLSGRSTSGLISVYGGGGFVQDLTPNHNDASAQLKDLRANLWIDRGTRVVFLDFTVYNANINLFCQIKLTVEFPASGGAVPSKSFSTVKLIRYVSSMDYFVLACEALFTAFTIYYTVEEAIEIRQFKLQYFKTIWNILDVLIIVISYICVAFNIYRQIKVGQILDELLKNQNSFADFEFLAYWQIQFNNIVAFAVFLAWIKIFKYVSFNKTMTQLSATLSRCAKDVMGFSVMFMIVFLAYAQLGYLLFGTMVDDYKTFSISIFTLFRIILGDFDFNAILSAHRIIGPMFFLTYVFFVFFVLLNMFLAIINDTYSEVKSDVTTQKSEFELGDYFKKSYENMLNRLNFNQDRIIDIQNALKSAELNRDGVIEFDEWRRNLKARGYADVEIENVFSHYDVDGDRVLRDDEQRRFKADLAAKENNLEMDMKDLNDSHDQHGNDQASNGNEGDSENRIAHDKFVMLVRRTGRMEYSIGNIVSRIDNVLNKIETIEKGKTKRREALTKILNSISADDKMGKEMKHQQLEKMIRDELEEHNTDCTTPVQSVFQKARTPGAPGNGR